MDRSRVGVVIPAFNESATILNIVKIAGRYGLPIVVDDGSTDDTAARAGQGGAVVVSHEGNYGYDAALNSGFEMAAKLGREVIITLDADGQHDPFLLQKFIDQIDAGADVVVGIRNRQQRFSEYLFAWYTTIRFGIEDPLCGLKAYRTAVYGALGHFDSYGSIGTELMMFAAKRRYQLRQIAFNAREREGRSKFGQVLGGNYKIIRSLMLSMFSTN